MEHHLCVLLYSNYSNACKNLLSALTSCPVDLYNLAGLNNVCIDNETIRKQITTSKNITITSVPCLLVIYQGFRIEKYDGQNLYDWIDNFVEKHLPPPPPPQVLPPPPQEPPPQEPTPEPTPEPTHRPTPKKPETPKKQVIIKNTEIDTLEDEDEDEDEDDPRPPRGIRNGAGGYDFENNFGKEQERTIESNKDSSSSGLMAAALAMQKERESS